MRCSRRYKELPLRWGELGTVYRYEPSGTLYGLLRVRGFTQVPTTSRLNFSATLLADLTGRCLEPG